MRIKSSGPMAKEANDTVPECLINVVQVQFTTDTELPSSFSGVKYHLAKQTDKATLPNVMMNDDVQINTSIMNQNL